MARYIVEIKHNLKQEKIYNFHSDIKVMTGDLVQVKRSNGKVSQATVLNCYEGVGEFTGSVAVKLSNNMNKLNHIIGNLVYEGKIVIPNSVYETYIDNTRDNENTTIKQFKSKLARNIILADKPKSTDGSYIVMFAYGAMQVFVNIFNNKVVRITNRNKQPKGWKKDIKLYNKLNEKFGIE